MTNGRTSDPLREPLVDKKKSSTIIHHRDDVDELGSHAQRRLKWAVYLATFFMLTEIIGGLLANSLAIITDAAHMMSDVGGFLVSMFSLAIVGRKANKKFSYGYHQAEVLGALISILLVWLLTGMLLLEAVNRFRDLESIDGRLMTGLSIFGLIVNLLLMKTLGHNHSHDHGGSTHGHEHESHGSHAPPAKNGHEHDIPHGHDHGKGSDHHGHAHDHGEEHGHEHGHGPSSGKLHEAPSDEAPTRNSSLSSTPVSSSLHLLGGSVPQESTESTQEQDVEKGERHQHHQHSLDDIHEDAHGNKEHGNKEHEIPAHEEEEEESLAMKAAMAHVIGDIVQSLGVIVAALVIWVEPFDIGHTENGVSRWNYADPFCTVFFAFLVMLTTKNTIISIYHSLMFTTPNKYVLSTVRASLTEIPHVLDAHDVHIWEIGRNPVCSAHVTVDKAADVSKVLKACIKVMTERYGIEHTTVQIEIAGKFDHTTEKYGRLHDHSLCCE